MDKSNNIKGIQERMKDNEQFDSKLKPPFPTNMLVELTNVCDSRCVFCANSKMTRKAGNINSDLLDRILREARSLGTTDVGFYGPGEPFLSDRLSEYVAKAKNIGFKYVYITTNGILATPERVHSVLEAGLDSIKFSINAGTAQTYERIHGHDSFDQVLNHLKFISEYRRKFGKPSKIYVSYVVIKQNQEECKILEDLVAPFVDDISFRNICNWGGLMHEINKVLKPENEESMYPQTLKPPCNMLFNRLHITYEGYLAICCVDYQNYLVVADLNHSSLKEAWHNETFLKVRKRHIDNNLNGILCYNCMYDKNVKVEPIMPAYATFYDKQTFALTEDILCQI